MKKGANNQRIFDLIRKGLKFGLELNSQDLKDFVITEYNNSYAITSLDTIAANLRENAIIRFQEEMIIRKVEQDGKGSSDLIAAKIVSNKVEIVISQQKGNDASFNSSSKSDTLRKLSKVKNGNYKDYFRFLPDSLNPDLNGLEYTIDVIIGYTNAFDDKVGTYNCKDSDTTIDYYCGDMYLRKLGINKTDMFDIDFWVSNQEKINNHSYDATQKCYNFNESYNNCVKRF
jgi:hypothetical protein